MSTMNEHTTSFNAKEVRRQSASATPKRTPPRKPTKKKKNPLKAKLIYFGCVFLAALILGECAWLVANDLCAFNKPYMEKEIEVVKSDSVGDITNKLKDAGFIEYKFFFRLFADLIHADQRIGVGTYTLNTNMDYKALINNMRNKNATLSADTVKVTIPEGMTVEKTFELLEKNGVATASDLREVALKGELGDYTFLDKSRVGSITLLEGYLFPDTYEFYTNMDAKKVIQKFLDGFKTKFDTEMLDRVSATGRSLDDIIIIASLIEKETTGKDQKTIASVIYNRLNNPKAETAGFLQLDCAKYYSTDAGYDLYSRKGLPVTAICNPGLASIEAAIEPNSTSYYFYALGTDDVHHFFKTYAEHLAFVNSSKYKKD